MPPNPPIVWHLDTTQIKDKFESPPDRLTLIKWVMNLFEVGILSLDEALKAFTIICSNQKTDKEIQLLLDKIQINADTNKDEIFKNLGIID